MYIILTNKNGAIFACTKKSEKECISKKLFGASKAHEDKALDVKKGDVLFLYNKDEDTLAGPYFASCDGKKNIDSKAWRGMYPYQVKINRNGKISKLNNFRKLEELLKLNWKNSIISHIHVKLLLDIINNNLVESDIDVKSIKQKLEKPTLESTTLWDYPTQSYGEIKKGDNKYAGVTPAYVIYNMVKRYTERGDLVVDPMCGSGTTIDVCKEEHRSCIGYDVFPVRDDIIQNDARKIPLEKDTVDMVFLDSPYGDNIKYNESPDNIGNLSAESDEFYTSMDKVAFECHRILKPNKVIGWLIGDQWVQKKFTPVSFRIYNILEKYFTPQDIVSVVRRNQSSNTGIWHNRALRHNFYLRGYKSLLIFKKDDSPTTKRRNPKWNYYER